MASFKGLLCCTALLALLFLQGAAAHAVAAGQPAPAALPGWSQGQPLTDSAMLDIRGKGTVTLSGFGNGVTNMVFLVNQVNGGTIGTTQSSEIINTPIRLSGSGEVQQSLSPYPQITTTLQSMQQLFQSWRR
jgi:hypothetical protein